MPVLTTLAAMLVPGVLRLGPLRISTYSLFAAIGIVAAIALSQRMARHAALDKQKLWDAGIFAIVAAFIVTRIILVAANFRAFLSYPLLVLTLPSLTYSGMILSAIAVVIYLRRQHLPLLATLDAWAAPACLLAAVLQLGHFVEGTDAGMPTNAPWGIHSVDDTIFARVEPVQLYAAFIALVLCALMAKRLRSPHRTGSIAAQGLVLGGIASFLLDMLRQPWDTFGTSLLDPAQYVAILAILAGSFLLLFAPTEVGCPGSVADPGEPAPIQAPIQEPHHAQ